MGTETIYNVVDYSPYLLLRDKKLIPNMGTETSLATY